MTHSTKHHAKTEAAPVEAGVEPKAANPLTASPDAVHMGTGAGTAVAQSAVGRYYADTTNGGWTTTPPA